ncbi:uncharacterized protein ISCGN_016397 [Ixodes scapularis]
MPGCCCAPNCNSNYVSGPKVRVYRFPSDAERRTAWTKAIPREDFAPTKYSVVCEKHFSPGDFATTTTYTDEKTGRVLEVPLQLRRLKPCATPSIFPNCPAYLSRNTPAAREGPEEKRARLEAEALQQALARSTEAYEDEQRNNSVSSFDELVAALKEFQVADFWTKLVTDKQVLFLNFAPRDAPVVRYSVTVSADLSLKAFFGDLQLDKVGLLIFPMCVSDIRELEKALEVVHGFAKNSSNDQQRLEIVLKKTVAILEELSSENFPHEWQMEIVNFLMQQVHMLLSKSPNYPADLLVFSSLVFTISPHAYRFIRSTSKLKLPHPDTIRRVCASYVVNPCTEQQSTLFLSYAKRLVAAMNEHEKTVTLVMDEIHLQPYLDYKGGTVVGMAANSTIAAKTAYVFMIQSLLSASKDVVHILPVAQIDAKQLHEFLRQLINELEKTGLRIIAVVSDNNSINGKAMSFFSQPPKVNTVYQHPSDQSRSLFFILDTVHVLKCVRNNWLNQRNSSKCMFFPDINAAGDQPHVLTASFNALVELHERERNELVRLAPTLCLKALKPSSLERQNVKLVLKIFNILTVAALRSTKAATLQHAKGTAEFINIIVMWWCIVNVKTPNKGRRLRDKLQEPITVMSCPQIDFLNKVVKWLDYWKSLKHDAGHLTNETHNALRHTSLALVQVSRYCIEELGFKYVLLGKFQSDCLEDRFGRYRQLSGAQYHISIRQIYESEHKLRLQKVLELPEFDDISLCARTDAVNAAVNQFDVEVTAVDVEKKEHMLPAITYVAGYCAHAALKKLMCPFCKENLVVDNRSLEIEAEELIAGVTRGELKFPQAVVVNAVLAMNIVLEKLSSERYALKFYSCEKQKDLLVSLTTPLVEYNEDLDVCENGHLPHVVMGYVLSAAANTLLNNLFKRENNMLAEAKAAKRKLKTLQA